MKEQILSILKTQPSIKRNALLSILRGLGYMITDRAMRLAIEEMIRSGELIESSNDGYSLITSEQQLEEAVRYLNAKAEAIAIRKNLLIHNWAKLRAKTNFQLTLI